MARTSLQTAHQPINRFFSQVPSKVYHQREIERILAENRTTWQIGQTLGVQEFIEYLCKNGELKRWDFPFPYRKETRYTWGSIPLQVVLLTLKPACHFSHHTAAQVHHLAQLDSKTIYLNFEQPAKPAPSGYLEQTRIDAAFARRPRVTSNVARVNDSRVCLINGKCTSYRGVETQELEVARGQRVKVRVTNLERTLIDIAVRPFYAGGVAEVLKAYVKAASRASTIRLAALLKQLDYLYPYHQAIGFYLERSGVFKPDSIESFRRKFRYELDFYLTYEMKKPQYDPKWRLFFPKGL